ncbi:MAG: ROK family protein [Bacteroidetes bacterium]|nr:ROK family protein [Bacteroidota bacterium]
MDFLKSINEANLSGVLFKNLNLKKNIIHFLDQHGQSTISEIGKELKLSTPKIISTINELIEEKILNENGKIESTGGRRANLFGLASGSVFFMGVEVSKYHISIGLMDLNKNMLHAPKNIPFKLKNSEESLENLISIINEYIGSSGLIKSKILKIGINLTGRINQITGHNYNYFQFTHLSVSEIIEKATGIKTHIDNDSRAMAFAEYCSGVVEQEKNILFINLDYGIGLGIIINGEIYYGKSGFSGEFGHNPIYDNEMICQCGKKGCLETEASGFAVVRSVQKKLKAGIGSILQRDIKKIDEITLEEIVNACNQDDTLAIECVAAVGEKLGTTNEYIRLPIKSSLNKFSSSLVNNDTQLKTSKLGLSAGVMGACLLVRRTIFSV